MSNPNPRKPKLTLIFGVIVGITVALWLLRGFGVLTFLPGGIISLLILASIVTGIVSRIQSRW